MKFTVILIVGLLAACSSTRDVTRTHPFSSTLLGACYSNAPLYLYRDSNGPYSILTSRIVTYPADGNGQPRVYKPQAILPSGSQITIDRIQLTQDMSSSPRIELVGVAIPSGTTERLPVRGTIDYAGVDVVQWQRDHGIMSLPSKAQYTARSKVSVPPWCQAPNNSFKPTPLRGAA